MTILYILIPLLIISVLTNYVQYQQKLYLRERLYETADWIDPVALATLDEAERADRLSLLPVYTTEPADPVIARAALLPVAIRDPHPREVRRV